MLQTVAHRGEADMLMRVAADGSGASYEPQSSSAPNSPKSTSPKTGQQDSRPAATGPSQQATRTALRAYRPGNATSKQNLENALWKEALSSASAPKLLDRPSAYEAERAKLQREYGGSLPSGMTPADLDSTWASAAANARARYDQAPAVRALQRYGEAALGKRPRGQAAPDSTITTNTQNAALGQVMDYYMAQQGQYAIPGTAAYSAEERKALTDPKGLAAAEQAFEQAHLSALPRAVQPTALAGFAHGGELTAAERQLPQRTAHAIAALGQTAPNSRARASAMSALATDGFDQEVMTYQASQHEGYAAPGSTQWSTDAQNLLNDQSALLAARDAVAVAQVRQLAAHGLNLRQFGAALWAGETVAQAQLRQQQDENPPLVCTPNGSEALSPLERQKQGEWDALTSLSESLSNLSSSGVEPSLARQALMANSYVGALAGEINETMQAVAAGKGATSADAIAFLEQTVQSSSIDPQLATRVVSASAQTLRRSLNDQSAASATQAAQAFVSTARIYYVMLTAAQASVPSARALATEINQWSYSAANSTNSTITVSRFSSSPSPLEQMLQQVLTSAQQQKVPANLLHDWVSLAQTPGRLQAVNNGLQQNASAWVTFQQSLDANRELARQPLPRVTPLTAPSPAQTPDQVHATYDQALMGLEHNGGLPSTVDPAAAAAAQTMMSPGYVADAADAVALARAMIAGETQQLDAVWLQQHAGEGLTTPVDFLTTQAAAQVSSLGIVSSSALQQGLRGMEAPLPTAPSQTVIARTTSAYEALEAAKASGSQHAVAIAQQAMNEAIANELLSVYSGQFAGNALLTNDENSDWRVLAEEQVARDHADDPQLSATLPALLEAGEITQASINPHDDQQSIAALDASLAPLQRSAADPRNAITQAVLNDARVRDLISRQISAATAGASADKPTAALAHEAAFIAPYEQTDPNGPVAQQIVEGTVAAAVTQRILETAGRAATAPNQDPLGVAAPLMQAAQASPTLALAVFNAFNLPDRSHTGAPAENALISAAGDLHDATDYRDAAIIYAALPDDPQVVGVAAQLQQAQAAKAAMLTAVSAQFGQRHDVAARNIKSWIRASFNGPNSAPDWLAQDLADGYQYQQAGRTKSVGSLKNQQLASTINAALYQSSSNNRVSTATPPSPDLIGRQNADGLTLQQFSSRSALASYVGAADGLRPTSGAGASATYNLNTVVYGSTTLGEVIDDIEHQAVGAKTKLTASAPVVLQAVPVEVNGQLVSAFRVENSDGALTWIGPGGGVTLGWQAQDAALTQARSNTVVQVVGGVSEANAQGNADPLLKTDTPPPPPTPHHSIWVSIAESGVAMLAGVALGAVDPFLGALAAFAVYQIFDQVSNDGNVTVFDFGRDLVDGRMSRKIAAQFAVDSGGEALDSLADGFGPVAGAAVSDRVGSFLATRFLASAGTDAAAATTTEAAAATTQAATRKAIEAAATASGVVTNQVFQGGAQVGSTALTLAAEGKLSAAPMIHVGIEQLANLAPAALTGGISGLAPMNLVVQTAIGYGSNVGQTEFDDRIFDHGQNITRDDLISAAIFTPAQTMIDVVGHPDLSTDPSSLSIVFGPKDGRAIDQEIANEHFTPGQDRAYVYDAGSGAFLGYATLERGEGQRPKPVWQGATGQWKSHLDALRQGRVDIVISDAAPKQAARGNLGDVVPYSSQAMDLRQEQRAGNDPFAAAVSAGATRVPYSDIAAKVASKIAEDIAPRVAPLTEGWTQTAGANEVERARAELAPKRVKVAGKFAANEAANARQRLEQLSQAGQALAAANTQLDSLAERIGAMDKTNVDPGAYDQLYATLNVIRARSRQVAELRTKTAQKLAAASEDELLQRFNGTFQNEADNAIRTALRDALFKRIREAANDAVAPVVAAADLRSPLAKARQAAQQAVDAAIPQLRPDAREAALDALADKRNPDTRMGEVTAQATLIATRAAELAAARAAPAAMRPLLKKALDQATLAINSYQLPSDEVRAAAVDAAIEALGQEAGRGLVGREDVDHVTQWVKSITEMTQALVARTNAVAAGELIRTDYAFYEPKQLGHDPGGFYEERSRGGKILLKQPVNPQEGDGREVSYATVLQNTLYRLGLGRAHVSDLRVVDMRLHPDDAATYGVGSPLIARVKYPSGSPDTALFSKNRWLQRRLLSPAAVSRNGLLEHAFINVLTRTKDTDPVGNNSVGFAGGRAVAVNVTPLGFNIDGLFRSLDFGTSVNLQGMKRDVGKTIDDLMASSTFSPTSMQDRINSLNNVLGRLSKETIEDELAKFADKIAPERLERIRSTLLARHDALTEQLNKWLQAPQVVAPTLDPADHSAGPKYARRWAHLRLSPPHESSWSSPRRFAGIQRALARIAWDVAPVRRSGTPDANLYPDPSPTAPDGVLIKAKSFETDPVTKVLATGAIFGLAGFGIATAKFLPKEVSDVFSIGRGFLNVLKYQGRFRKAAYDRVLKQIDVKQTDYVKLMRRLQLYHGSLEHTLATWEGPGYQRYLTVSADARAQLQRNTEDILGRLAQLAVQTDPQTNTNVRELLKDYFRAQDHVMGVRTADLQFFAQATNAGAVVQHLLVIGYLGSLAIDLHHFITTGVPRGTVEWLTTSPDYINDLGKVGSLLNAASSSWARWSRPFPFKPDSPFARVLKTVEPYFNQAQGIGNLGGAAAKVYEANVVGHQGFGSSDVGAIVGTVAGAGYLARGLEPWLKKSSGREAGSAAASALGGEIEADVDAEGILEMGDVLHLLGL